MRFFISLFLFVIVSSFVDSTLLTDIISFNVKQKNGYEGFVDEKTRTIDMTQPIEAKISKRGISASRKICGFILWSRLSDSSSLPFIVRRSGNRAILKVKEGADLKRVKQEFKFFIQAFDCDPVRHKSVKIPVVLHLIPSARLPIFSENAYSFKVLEGKPSGTAVGKIKASEHGSGSSSAMCNYKVVRPEDAPFDVDGNGVIYTVKKLHVAEVSNYILRVRADDCYKPRPRSSLVSVNIRIEPVCKLGWHGVFAQLNYRAGSGAQAMADASLGLVVACLEGAALPTVRGVRVSLRLSPGARSACPRSDGCPLSPRERLAPGLGKERAEVTFEAPTVAQAVKTMREKALFYVNDELEPTPSKRLVEVQTVATLEVNGSRRAVTLPVHAVTVVLLPRRVPLLHPNVDGQQSSAMTVPDTALTGRGYPVLRDLRMLLQQDRAAGKQEPSVDFCVLRIHPKLTPVAYLEWPKQAVRAAKLKALNTSNQFNLKGVAPASVYLDILRQVRYHHAYPYALNSSSFVLVCLEHNSPNQDAGDSSMLVLKLRIQHENGAKATTAAASAAAAAVGTPSAQKVAGSLHDPPPAIMHEKLPSFEEVRPAAHAHRVASSVRHHVDESPLGPVTSGGTWSAGAVVGFVLGLIFLALAVYLAVMRYRRHRSALLHGGPLSPAGVGAARLGGLRHDAAERHPSGGGGGLEMEWDNSELNITVNPMEESFTKYSQVVHYREFSSDDDADDDEDLSSLLSGIPEEGEEESARSCGSGSYGGVVVGNSGAPVSEDQDWQWEDDMLPAYTHRPSPLGNAHV